MTSLPTEPFWMVYGIGQGSPNARHKTSHSAWTEAERLARTHPGVCFVVLESIAAVAKQEFVTVKFREPSGPGDLDDEIPF